MKTKEELNALKEEEEEETVSSKRIELDVEELEQVTGGSRIGGCALVNGNGVFAGC